MLSTNTPTYNQNTTVLKLQKFRNTQRHISIKSKATQKDHQIQIQKVNDIKGIKFEGIEENRGHIGK